MRRSGRIQTDDRRQRRPQPPRLDRFDPLWVTIAGLLVLGTLAGIGFWRGCHDGGAARQAALSFVCVIRDAQAYARANRRFVTLDISMRGLDHTTVCAASDGARTFIRRPLPDSVAAAGLIRMDEQGALVKPASILFRKGSHVVRLEVSQSGQVSFPAD